MQVGKNIAFGMQLPISGREGPGKIPFSFPLRVRSVRRIIQTAMLASHMSFW